jgi:hypothetical protein
MQDLFEPALTGEFVGANFILAIDVILLQLHPVVAEATAEQMGPSNVILRRDCSVSKLGSRLSVGMSKRGSSWRAPWMRTMRIICRSGWVQSLASSLRRDARNVACHSTRCSQAKMWGAVLMVSRQEGHCFPCWWSDATDADGCRTRQLLDCMRSLTAATTQAWATGPKRLPLCDTPSCGMKKAGSA